MRNYILHLIKDGALQIDEEDEGSNIIEFSPLQKWAYKGVELDGGVLTTQELILYYKGGICPDEIIYPEHFNVNLFSK